VTRTVLWASFSPVRAARMFAEAPSGVKETGGVEALCRRRPTQVWRCTGVCQPLPCCWPSRWSGGPITIGSTAPQCSAERIRFPANGRKLGCPGRLAAVRRQVPHSHQERYFGQTLSTRHWRYSYNILPHHSTAAASRPRLFGPPGQPVQCWGECLLHLQFQGEVFSWLFLLAAVDFLILGVDFLKSRMV
jgi:hypothetical protein